VGGPAPDFEIRKRTPLVLAVFLAASAAVHAAGIAAFPAPSLERAPAPAAVLEVVLVQTAPTSPLPVGEPHPVAATNPLPPANPIPIRHAARLPTASKAVVAPPAVAVATPLSTPPEPAPEVKTVSPMDRPEAITGPKMASPARVAIAAPTPARFSASYLQNPAPRYPLAARRAGEQGTVTLKVLVSIKGLPRRVEIEKTSGSSRLDTAARDAVGRWRFNPARRGNAPIESWVLVPVVFRLEEPS